MQDRKLSVQVPSAPQKGSPVQHERQRRPVTELQPSQQMVSDSLNTFIAGQAQEGVLDFVAAAAQEAEVRQFLMGSLEGTPFKRLRLKRPVRAALPCSLPNAVHLSLGINLVTKTMAQLVPGQVM